MKRIFYSNIRTIVLAAITLVSSLFTPTIAQQDSLNSLLKKFDTYRINALQEKVFLHTDRASYLTGEILWFKVYYMDAVTHRPLNISKVVYVEVIDSDKKSVIQAKVELDDAGQANGSLFIPASLASGNFVLRAYTNWMKNFDNELFFHQPLVIINPFTALGPRLPEPQQTYDVQFFPEGGNLVDGLTSVVGFRAVDRNGAGIEFTGMIIDENNANITTFSPAKFGIGTFTFRPSAAHHYKAVVFDRKGKEFRYDLPKVQEYGYVITVKDTVNNNVSVLVQSKISPADNNAFGAYLFAHTRGVVAASNFTLLFNGKARFMLNKSKLGDGIAHITLFNTELQPVCERLYFNSPTKNLKVDVYPDQSVYGPRSKVSLNVQTESEASAPVPASLSVAVYKTDSLASSDPQSIVNFLWLGSELKGNIESIQYYADQGNQEVKSATDNLMLTHGWRRFSWNTILHPDGKAPEYMPEHEKHIITGRVLSMEDNKPVPFIPVYLASPGKIVRTYSSKSNADGIIRFEMQNFYGQRELVAQTNSSVDSLYRIEVASPFIDYYSTDPIASFDVTENRRDDIEQRAIHMQVQRSFYEASLNTFRRPVADSVAFFGKPDEKYLLDDYTRFPTMEEVMREYVPGVMVRKRAGKFHFLTLDDPNHSVFKENPLVLLDGIPVFNIDKIMAFDPRKIKRLEVLRQRFFNGPMAFDGIVSYSTYTGDLAGFELDPKTLNVPYEGLQLRREFFNPVYETPAQRESPKPDARDLLFWSPNVTTGTDGKVQVEFYTSDISGKYKVVVEGLTNDGRPGHTSQTIEVREKKNY